MHDSEPASTPIRLRSPAAIAAVAGVLWAVSAAAPGGPHLGNEGIAPAADSGTRLSGEYGLWVTLPSDSVAVHWFTSGRTEGRLEVLAGDPASDRGGEGGLRTLLRTTTPRSRGHRVAFARPEESGLLLRYGSTDSAGGFGGQPSETEIRLDDPPEPVHDVEGIDSLYVVGDVHGEYRRLVRLLRNAGLVDGEGRWAGGARHLVFMGDLVDRGSDVRRTLWYVYGLQLQAARVGGRVHTLLGNHEIMVLTGDHRYVQPKERLMARLYGVDYATMFHPERSVLGRWIASWPVALRVDGALFAHGGIGPAYRGWSVETLNDSVRAWTREPLFRYFADTTLHVHPMDSAAVARRIQFFFEGPSPLWYRGFARTDTLGRELRRTLMAHDARLHVIAHTPVPETRHAYRDSVLLVDLEEPASELLLLVRSGDAYEAWAVPLEGEPRRVRPSEEGQAGGESGP